MIFQPYIWILTLQTALTPQERFQAVRQLDSSGGSNLLTNKWFVLLGWSVIILLSLLLVAVRQMRKEKATVSKERHFNDQADALNLTPQERDTVKTIADLAGIKHRSMVFSMRETFNSGLTKLKQNILAHDYNPDEWANLKAQLSGIKEKLGFSENKYRTLNNRSSRELTSRQIPIGTEVVMTLKKDQRQCVLGAIIIESNEFEMLLQCSDNITCQGGDIWILKFQNGAVTWEFEAITVELAAQGLKLSHSENVRFVNRRRFEGVKTSQPAGIAVFPVFRETTGDTKPFEIRFNPAEVIEIAGSRLSFKTSIDLHIRQRVIVLFELEHGRVMQDIGEVRNIVESDTERSYQIEMIGLSHKDINELIRITNQILSHRPTETAFVSVPDESSKKEVCSDV